MSDVAICVEGIGKQYRIGARHGAETFREKLSRLGRTPWLAATRCFHRQSAAPIPRHEGCENLFWALKDVSFDVPRGEVVGIIGRNGAGKSTLLKILSRITEPTTGSVEIEGRVASLLEVGTGFHPELTGRENVYLNGAILGMTRAEIRAKFDEIAAFAEVSPFIDTPVKHYSSGMYMRLAFAVAAHLESEILVVDEVLAVGDASFQKKCLGKMGEAAQGGRTVLFVSHHIGSVRRLCKKVVWLDRGGVQMIGEANAITDHYSRLSFSNESMRTFDLSHARRPATPPRFRIDMLHIDSDVPICYEKPLEMTLHYTCFDVLEDVSVGVGFCTPDGVRILTIESDCESPRRRTRKGKGQATLSLARMPLTPGLYLLDVGARIGDAGCDYLSQCAQVVVCPAPHTEGHVYQGCQDVRIPAVWKWDDAEHERAARPGLSCPAAL